MSDLDEDRIAILGGSNGPGITGWVSGVHKPCVCGHAKIRHGEAGGAGCGFLGCRCEAYRSALISGEGTGGGA